MRHHYMGPGSKLDQVINARYVGDLDLKPVSRSPVMAVVPSIAPVIVSSGGVRSPVTINDRRTGTPLPASIYLAIPLHGIGAQRIIIRHDHPYGEIARQVILGGIR